jgi:hypothetical protein
MVTKFQFSGIVAVLVVPFLLSSSAISGRADVYNWIGPSEGNWNDSANWTGVADRGKLDLHHK